jgi:hypothetical protein
MPGTGTPKRDSARDTHLVVGIEIGPVGAAYFIRIRELTRAA